MARKYAAYKVHRQMYPATYNFRDAVDGVSGTSIDWVDTETATDTGYSISVVASEDGHRKALKFVANGDNGANVYWTRDFTNSSWVIFEFWGKYIDNGQGRNDYYFYSDAGQVIAVLRFESAGNFFVVQHGNGAGGTTTVNTAAAADTWHHIRIKLECASDFFTVWLNGNVIITDQNFYNDRTATTINYLRLYLLNGGGVNSLEGFMDAWANSGDANYNVGDNCFWRHYKDQDSAFESEDVGTQGTSISFCGAVQATDDIEIVNEFNEHKKVIRTYRNSGNGWFINYFSSDQNTGTIELFGKVADVTADNRIVILRENNVDNLLVRISASRFEYKTGGVWTDATVAAVNDTWYHVKVQWYSDNTFDLWVNNILYLDGANMQTNMTDGMDSYEVMQVTAGSKYIYIDAVSYSWTSGNSIADNRTFDYNDSYTREDVTNDIYPELLINKKPYEMHPIERGSQQYRVGDKAIIPTLTTFTFDDELHVVQIYNNSSTLVFEGYVKEKEKVLGKYYLWKCKSLNQEALEDLITHDWTGDASTVLEMLQDVFTNVGQADGRLILDTSGDDPSGDFTFSVERLPACELLELIADLQQRVVEIKANGVIKLSTGTSLGVNVTSTSGHVASEFSPKENAETKNWVKVYGGWDIANQKPYEGVSQDADDVAVRGYRRYWDVYDSILSASECVSKALALRTNLAGIKWMEIDLKGLDFKACFNKISFAYSPYSMTAEDYYLLETEMEMFSEVCKYRARTGIVPASKYDRALITDRLDPSYAKRSYETDINTVYPQVISDGALSSQGWTLDSTKYHRFYLYIDDKIDADRDIIITMVYTYTSGLTGVTCDANLNVGARKTDGSESASFNVENATAINLPCDATGLGNHFKYSYTLSSSDFENGDEVVFETTAYEAQSAGYVKSYSVRYFIKKEV